MKPMHAPDDEKLRTLLRGARPARTLPPRFEENVWRRIEAGEKRISASGPGWLTLPAGWLLKPKFALAVAALVGLAGIGLGWNSAEHQARSEAQARYLAAVAPNSLR
jgi:hypothetical protein